MVQLALLNSFAALACTLPSLVIAAPTSQHAEHTQLEARQIVGGQPAPGSNNYNCRSTQHPNPVVFLHGFGSNENDLLVPLQTNLSASGYCTFTLTYGAYPLLPFVGGLRPVDDSSNDIAAFIRDVRSRTGAAKIDLIGHSEGALQALYVAKVKGVSGILDKIIPIAPPTHGTTISGIYDLTYAGGAFTREVAGQVLATVGAPALNDVGPDGPAVKRLNDGTPIRQPGNTITIIISRNDRQVTPPETSELREPGVRNVYVQDACPNDPVGHVGLVSDTYVWGLVTNALDPRAPLYPCTIGQPAP